MASLTVGQAVEAMVCNRLTSPAPLVHVGDWARDWAVPEILGIPALALNDDKLGRTLDAIAPHLEEITGAVAVRAIAAFGIDISQLHWDITSFSLYGAYPEADEDTRRPPTGTPKTAEPICCSPGGHRGRRRRRDLGLRPRLQRRGRRDLPGDRGDQRPAEDRRDEEVPPGRGLQADQLQQRRRDREGRLHVPGARVQALRQGRRAGRLRPGRATEVAYAAGRDQHKKNTSPGQLGRWHVLEDDQPFWIRNSKRKSAPPIRLRRIFVHSTARAGAALTSRAKKLTRAKDDLDRLVSGLGGRFYPSQDKVTARLQQIARDRKVGFYLRYTLGTAPAAAPAGGRQGTGQGRTRRRHPRGDRTRPGGHLARQPQRRTRQTRPHLVVRPGRDRRRSRHRRLVRPAHQPRDQITPAQVLLRYKEQEAVERRYGNLKGRWRSPRCS